MSAHGGLLNTMMGRNPGSHDGSVLNHIKDPKTLPGSRTVQAM